MTPTTASASQAATASFKRSGHTTGATIYPIANSTDALAWLGKPCYDPNGNIHIMYSVNADGKCECPKGFHWNITDMRAVNAS